MVSLTRFNERNLRSDALTEAGRRAAAVKGGVRGRVAAQLARQPATANPRLTLRKIGEGVGDA